MYIYLAKGTNLVPFARRRECWRWGKIYRQEGVICQKLKGRVYSVLLPRPVEKDLDDITEQLQTTKAEVLRRSIVLFKHALNAERVALYTTDEGGQEVAQQVSPEVRWQSPVRST